MANICDNSDGLICDGINGFKSIVQGFAGAIAPTPTPEPVTSVPDEATEPTPPPPPPPVVVTSTSPPEVVTVSVTPPASSSTDTAQAPPPPPPEMASPQPQAAVTNLASQLIVPTPVPVLLTSTRASFIETLPTRTATALNPSDSPLVPGILASQDSNSAIGGPATATAPTPEGTAAPGSAAAQGTSSDTSTQFPTALIAGVSGGVVAFIFIFALLWRWYLRRQSEKRNAGSIADEKGLVITHKHFGSDDPFERPSDRITTTQIWTGPKAFKPEQSRFSWAATESSLGEDLEPLTPKPVIQQTVHKVSVPPPVEASSFRTSSKEGSVGSVRSSVSRSPPASQQAVVREVVITQVRGGKLRSSARSQVPDTDYSLQSKGLATPLGELEGDVPEELEGDPVPDLSDFDMETAMLQKEEAQKEEAQKEEVQKEEVQKEEVQKEEVQKEEVQKEEVQKEEVQKEGVQKEEVQKEEVQKEEVQKEEVQAEGSGLKRQYTLRHSPLHQNPFIDPVEEEEEEEEDEDDDSESSMAVTFEIVNKDAPSPKGAPESEPDVQGVDDQERSASPMNVLQTITLTAEDLKRASTAKTIAE